MIAAGGSRRRRLQTTRSDHNTLVGPGFPDRGVSAQDINEAGEITGRVLQHGTGKTLPLVAAPVNDLSRNSVVAEAGNSLAGRAVDVASRVVIS
jgi:hypothetical protein